MSRKIRGVVSSAGAQKLIHTYTHAVPHTPSQIELDEIVRIYVYLTTNVQFFAAILVGPSSAYAKEISLYLMAVPFLCHLTLLAGTLLTCAPAPKVGQVFFG